MGLTYEQMYNNGNFRERDKGFYFRNRGGNNCRESQPFRHSERERSNTYQRGQRRNERNYRRQRTHKPWSGIDSYASEQFDSSNGWYYEWSIDYSSELCGERITICGYCWKIGLLYGWGWWEQVPSSRRWDGMETHCIGSDGKYVNVFDQAKELYEDIGIDMFKDISVYMAHGYVFKTPHSLLLGKPVRKDGGDPDGQWDVMNPNAWYVRTAVGDGAVGEFISRIPYALPWVGWMRHVKNKPVKWYTLDQVRRRM